MKFLWLAVTADEYELPIFVEDTAEKLAKKCGLTTGAIFRSISRNSKNQRLKSKIIKVAIDD